MEDPHFDCKKQDCFFRLFVSDALDQKEVKLLHRNHSDQVFSSGEMVCRQGSNASHIVYIRRGLAKVIIEGQQRLIARIVSGGTLLQLPALFMDRKYHYSVITYSDSSVCYLESQAFRELLETNSIFSKRIVKLMSQETVQLQERFYSLSRKQLPGRLADVLIDLAGEVFHTTEFKLPFQRQDLAELTGTTTESVIRILRDFHADEMIHLSGKKMKLLDMQRLQMVSKLG